MGNNEKKSCTLSVYVCVCELSGCQVSLAAFLVSTIPKYFSILLLLECPYFYSFLLNFNFILVYFLVTLNN